MKLFVIEPEVAGEIGERTIYENYDAIKTKGERPIISHLHFVFKVYYYCELNCSVRFYMPILLKEKGTTEWLRRLVAFHSK